MISSIKWLWYKWIEVHLCHLYLDQYKQKKSVILEQTIGGVILVTLACLTRKFHSHDPIIHKLNKYVEVNWHIKL